MSGDARDIGASPESSPLARRRMLLAPAASLVAVALVALACGTWIEAKAWVGQCLLERAWRAMQADPARAAVAPWPWADTAPVARLLAPAQHADVLVLAGATGRTLAWGPGHLDGTPLPGAPGNAVLTAHRDTHFAFLARLAVGDPLDVETRAGRHRHYRVTRVRIVDIGAIGPALAAGVDADAGASALTLVTCYPFAALAPGTRMRFVATAIAVD
ncbi:MAG: class GN sortase [Proteobacteria bacterium]|nr:class GN sortase [Pseudomonadota bacterium]